MVLRPFFDNPYETGKRGKNLTGNTEAQIAELEKAPTLVTIQANFTNGNAVPRGIRTVEKEASEKRRTRHTGKQILTPTENVFVLSFLNDIRSTNYVLVDASYQERLAKRDKRMAYNTAQFVFANKESEGFFKRNGGMPVGLLTDELKEMLYKAAWRTRVYLNPLYHKREYVLNEFVLTTTLDARKPLFLPNGEPIREWQRGPNGEKIGDRPLPKKPDFALEFRNNEVRIA